MTPEIDFAEAWERASDFFAAADRAYDELKADRIRDEDNQYQGGYCIKCGISLGGYRPSICGACSGCGREE